MVKAISFKTHKQQDTLIIREINSLLNQIAYDGRIDLKVRLRKSPDFLNKFILEVKTESLAKSKILFLETNPFNLFWIIFSKRYIKKNILLVHCKKSAYGGYTFY